MIRAKGKQAPGLEATPNSLALQIRKWTMIKFNDQWPQIDHIGLGFLQRSQARNTINKNYSGQNHYLVFLWLLCHRIDASDFSTKQSTGMLSAQDLSGFSSRTALPKKFSAKSNSLIVCGILIGSSLKNEKAFARWLRSSIWCHRSWFDKNADNALQIFTENEIIKIHTAKVWSLLA